LLFVKSDLHPVKNEIEITYSDLQILSSNKVMQKSDLVILKSYKEIKLSSKQTILCLLVNIYTDKVMKTIKKLNLKRSLVNRKTN
jgi:hypothetical protein